MISDSLYKLTIFRHLSDDMFCVGRFRHNCCWSWLMHYMQISSIVSFVVAQVQEMLNWCWICHIWKPFIIWCPIFLPFSVNIVENIHFHVCNYIYMPECYPVEAAKLRISTIPIIWHAVGSPLFYWLLSLPAVQVEVVLWYNLLLSLKILQQPFK